MQEANQKPVILFYLPWSFDLLGGVDVVVDRLYNGLANSGATECYIGLQSWSEFGYKKGFGDRYFAYLNFPEPPKVNSIINWARYLLTLLHRLPKTIQTLRSLQITTINAHFATANLFTIALLKKLRLWRGKILISFHGSDVKSIDKNSWIWKFISTETNEYICCSEFLARQVAEIAIFANSTAHTIHNGIKCEDFRSLVDTNPLKNANRPYIINIGTYIPLKGQDILLHAFKEVISQFPEFRLIFVGGRDNGDWLEKIASISRDLNISESVYFKENLSQRDVANLINGALCMAHPSRREAFPLVLLEAGSLGIPVIASNVGGISELIEDQKTGILVEPEDVKGLVAGINSLIIDEEKRRNLGCSLKKNIENNFSAGQMCEKYIRIIKSLN